MEPQPPPQPSPPKHLFPMLHRENSLLSKQKSFRGSGRHLLQGRPSFSKLAFPRLSPEKSQKSVLSPSNWSRDVYHEREMGEIGVAVFPSETIHESTTKDTGIWKMGDYVLAKCHSSEEFFPGHIQWIDDGVYTILFDDLTCDKRVSPGNILGPVDGNTPNEIHFIPMKDHKDDESEVSVVVDVKSAELDLSTLSHILKAMPNLDNHQKSSVVFRAMTVLYDEAADPPVMTYPLDVFSIHPGQSEELRADMDKQMQRIHATLIQMEKSEMHSKSTKIYGTSVNTSPPKPHFDDLSLIATGNQVVVHTAPSSYFGVVHDIPAANDYSVLDIGNQKLQLGIHRHAMQQYSAREELTDQYRELIRSHDVLYPGSKVLLRREDQLVPCTIRRRRTPTCFDIKIDGTLGALTHVKIDKLIATPRLPPRRVTVTNQLEIESTNGWFHVHERVIVHDLDCGVSNNGYISCINSNKTVTVEFDNGEVDTSVPLAFLRKAEASLRDASTLLAVCLNLDQSFGVGDDQFNIDDCVMAYHPMSNLLERGHISQLHGNNLCDVLFDDGAVVKQIPFQCLEMAHESNVQKPDIFPINSYVMAFNPRFKKYCTGQIQAVIDGTYRIVFDYGETYDAVPHEYVTSIEDKSVLSPKKRITCNWKSSNGFECEHDISNIICHGDLNIHKEKCLKKKLKQQYQQGEAVMAQYSTNNKYFKAIVLNTTENIIDVNFASTETGLGISPEKIFSIDQRHLKPVLFQLNSDRRRNSTITKPPSPSKPDSPSKSPHHASILSRMRTMIFSRGT